MAQNKGEALSSSMQSGAAGQGATTGRYLVVLNDDVRAGIRSLESTAGFKVASSADFETGMAKAEGLSGADAVVFYELGVAVVDAPPEQVRSLNVAAQSHIVSIEEERYVYAIGDVRSRPPTIMLSDDGRPRSLTRQGEPLALDYFRGYRDAVNTLVGRLLGEIPADEAGLAGVENFNEELSTWGLQATGVPQSRFSGEGIRVAVLDTGFDAGHPDFIRRVVQAQSFVPNETPEDVHGHGTHCIGTSMGSRSPGQLPRYGVAYGAEIFAGKVLGDSGSGSDSGILAGITWAIVNKCAVVSMSLGAPTVLGQRHSTVFERAAQRALAAGTLIIAAAGNESRRPHRIEPVSHPANCPSIMAVGAVDRQFVPAWFTCGGLNPEGGQVDIAAPGVDVLSSVPRDMLYDRKDGTSMATPHVAGIAALYAESNAELRGRALSDVLLRSARRLNQPSRDVGVGLVQAP